MYSDDNKSLLRQYFGVLTSGTTYKNLAYLLLSFPLGLMYFLFLVIGFSLGTSLMVIGVGLLILLAMVFMSIGILDFERRLSNSLLDADIPPLDLEAPPGSSIWDRLRYAFRDGTLIKGVTYLFMRFPFGIMGLILAIFTVALPFGMIFAPFSYLSGDSGIDSFGTSLIVSMIGLLIGPAILHFSNFTMEQWRIITAWMLTNGRVLADESKAKRRYVEVGVGEKQKRAQEDDSYNMVAKLKHQQAAQTPPNYAAPSHLADEPQRTTGTHRSIADLVKEALADDHDQRRND